MINCYFAQPITHFNTSELIADLKYLQDMSYHAYVPDSEMDERCYKAEGMDYYRRLIVEKNFQAIVFRSFANGKIGKGVSTELLHGHNALGIPLLELREFVFGVSFRALVAVSPEQVVRRTIDVSETRALIRHIKNNKDTLDGLGNAR